MWTLGLKPRSPSLYNKHLYLLNHIARSSLFLVPLLSLALVFLFFGFFCFETESLYIALAAMELAMNLLGTHRESLVSDCLVPGLKVSATTPSWLSIFNFFHKVTSVIIIVYV